MKTDYTGALASRSTDYTDIDLRETTGGISIKKYGKYYGIYIRGAHMVLLREDQVERLFDEYIDVK